MVEHCAHARFVWNLALEQANCWRRHWGPTPTYTQQAHQLVEARKDSWLGEGSSTVQQQALRDFDRAMQNWWNGTHGRPTWRKVGVHEGFRKVDVAPNHIQRLNRRWGQVLVPKVGYVRFRWTRDPGAPKSYRVTLDRAGRWHVAFAVIPPKIEGPGDGSVVGVDRGVANSAALSTGERTSCPSPGWAKRARLQRRMQRQQPGSHRRERTRKRAAKVTAKDVARRKDWTEKLSTDLARRFDLIRMEDLRIRNMTMSARGTGVARKRGLNRAILASGWGLLERRCKDKGIVELVSAAFTSQRCSSCGEVNRNSRESQAKFRCVACGMIEHADVNAAINIAAGRAVTGRGDISKAANTRVGGALSAKRQPQLL